MNNTSAKNKAIFIDKDGTLLVNVPYNVDPDLVKFQEGALEGLRQLQQKGYLLFIVSNQSGVSMGFFNESELHQLDETLREMLAREKVTLNGSYYCPHHPDGAIQQYAVSCDCRKPAPGMLLRAAAEFDLDLESCWMLGDILNDVEAGNRAGCKTILIDNGNESEWDLHRNRIPDLVARDISEAARLIFTINDIIQPYHRSNLQKHVQKD
jgi:D,D-heptose 1,7-bisphosphate phosphatase